MTLIERLEKAAGPDRELDGDIAMATGPWTKYDLGDNCWQWRFNGVNFGTHPPHYTSSLDAALTLVPAHSAWAAEHDAGFGKSTKRLPFAFVSIQDDRLDHMSPKNPQHIGRHDCPAIALCIACLKARNIP